ncbi:unnamed protein product, partial [Ectocarpus sp. 4 AP-2014]
CSACVLSSRAGPALRGDEGVTGAPCTGLWGVRAPSSRDCRRLRRSCQHRRDAGCRVQRSPFHMSRRARSEEIPLLGGGRTDIIRTNYITGVYRCKGEYGGSSQVYEQCRWSCVY